MPYELLYAVFTAGFFTGLLLGYAVGGYHGE